MKILTVDDSRTVRRLVSRALKPLGMAVVEASDGQQGLARAATEKPDLIVLDITMPGMGGIETLENLRAKRSTRKIPVIMLTAESRKETVMLLLRLGISDYIVKPFTEALLVSKVCAVLKLDPSQLRAGSAEGSASLPKVLVVDDKAPVLATAKRFLDGTADVVATASPFEAVELACRQKPDVVILDLVLPDVSTLEIFGMMRTSRELQDTRFVAMGIRTMRDEVARAYRAGFHDVLMKPFVRNQIIRTVRRNLPGERNFVAYGEDVVAINLGPFIENRQSTGVFGRALVRVTIDALREAADSGYEHAALNFAEAEATPDRALVAGLVKIVHEAEQLGLRLSAIAPQDGLSAALKGIADFENVGLFASLDELEAAQG